MTYSTGVNDALLPAGFTPGNFHAFIPENIPRPTPAPAGRFVGTATGLPAPGPNPDLAAQLTDGPNGLELATALFNLPPQTLAFPVTLSSTANTSAPMILATQMGETGRTDVYRFVNSAGALVGNTVSVTYPGAGIGTIEWHFSLLDGTASSTPNGTRNIRMAVFSLADFGLSTDPASPAYVGNVAAFEQILNGQSDVAFVAYNQAILTITAPDMQVTSVNLPSGVVGTPYSGSFVCTNQGTADGTAATCEAPAGLPAWASVSCSPATPVATLAVGATITCTVSGTPDQAGTSTVTLSTNADADAIPTNNSTTAPLTITAVAASVPTLSQWGLMLVAVLLGLTGWRQRRR